MAQYGLVSYWDERYKRDTEFFDWYQRWAGVKDVLKKYMSKNDRFLIIGCGLSRLSEDMYEEGFKSQVNIDTSKVAIDTMAETYKGKPSMEFRVMDVTNLSAFAHGSFDCAVDKGTLDAILCGENSTTHVSQMLKEVSRVLKPDNGRYICITYGQPSFRLPYLERPELQWTVQVQVVPKPVLAAEASFATDDQTRDIHYIYICTKSLPAAQAPS